MKKNVFVALLVMIAVLSLGLIFGCSTTSTDTTTTTTAATTSTTTTTTTNTTTTTVSTSGEATLHYIGNSTEEGHSLFFSTGTTSYESILSFTGDLINVGSYLETPATSEGAGLVDMGIATLASVATAPASGYDLTRTPSGGAEDVGRVYCIKTKASKYAKIRVSSFETDANYETDFTFDWVFRTDGERTF